MKHGHGLHRHAVIAIPPHDKVPHVCPIRTSNLSVHRLEAYVHSLTEREVYESLRDLRGSFRHSHGHSVTSINARASLVAALRDSRHAHLLIGSGAHAGTKWGKSGGRVGPSHKDKKDKDGKDSGPEEGEGSEEVGRLVGIELECQHVEKEEKPEGKGEGHGEGEAGQEGGEGSRKEGSKAGTKRKSRWAEAGEVLGIVPRATTTDTVKLKAKTERNPAWISWTGKGWKGFTHQGEEFSYKVPGYALGSIIDLLPENGIWGARTPPKVIEVEAKDPDGRSCRAKIAVYPDHGNTVKGSIGKKHEESEHEDAKQGLLGGLFKIAECIEQGLKKIPLIPVEIEFARPQGMWHVTMGFQEDPESNQVFMLVDLGAAFDPLLGVKLQFPIPVVKLAKLIPEKLREHLADIRAEFELEGKLFLNLSVGRLVARELNAKGEFGGVLGLGLNFEVEVGAKKVLKVIAKAGTEIKPEGFIQSNGIGSGEELKIYRQVSVEFGGLTGSIAWDVWDGKFTHENSWHFMDPVELYKSPKQLLF